MQTTSGGWGCLGLGAALALGLMACGPGAGEAGSFGGSLGPGTSSESLGSSGATGIDPSEGTDESGEPGSTGGADETGDTGEPPPSPQACNYPSTSFGQGMQELDVPTGSPEVLSYSVMGVPDPASIESATLHFTSYDADHPGEEGVVRVNGMGPYDLPADLGWDNAMGSGSIDVSGALVAGLNMIEFGAGSLEPRSFYRIGDVRLEVIATVAECEEPPEPPPADAVPRQVEFMDADYTMRHNWVLRCDGNPYAYTASSDEHIPSDCDGLYAPDGTRRGTATFSFPALVPATYEIQIRSRHTVNRNPLGALFVVDGEGIRVDQRDDADYVTDIWGVRELGGDTNVVLDSSQESESDSVIWVRLEPVGG